MRSSSAAVHPDDASTGSFDATVAADTIQTAVSLVEALVDECHVYVDDGGVRLSAVDAATVASVEVELGRGAFESLEATGDHVGVDLSRLGDVVGMADRDQPVRLVLDAETRTLRIRIGDLDYTLALLDPETVRKPPDASTLDAVEFTGEVVAAAEEFDRAVQAAEMVSDHLALGIDDAAGAFYAEAEGDTDDASLALPAEDLVDFAPGEAHSLFSVDYLTAIDRAVPNEADLRLRLGTEQPLALECAFAGGDGSVEYLVSPRITTR